jgi:hypothetical protein
MNQWIRAASLASVAAVAFAPQAAADRGTSSAPRQDAAPLKDCTRFNGRHGYYGNPWCSPAEQALWDKWEARRFTRR